MSSYQELFGIVWNGRLRQISIPRVFTVLNPCTIPVFVVETFLGTAGLVQGASKGTHLFGHVRFVLRSLRRRPRFHELVGITKDTCMVTAYAGEIVHVFVDVDFFFGRTRGVLLGAGRSLLGAGGSLVHTIPVLIGYRRLFAGHGSRCEVVLLFYTERLLLNLKQIHHTVGIPIFGV